MAGSFQVDVNAQVLRWARETGGFSLEEAGERLGNLQALETWETGAAQPTWTALNKLARLYKRPVTALLLPQPPSEPPPPPDFRTLPQPKAKLSPEVRAAIRTATWLATTAAELRLQLGVTVGFQSGKADRPDDPGTLARKWRDLLGVSIEEQIEWQGLSQGLRRWREAVETQGILVFQFSLSVEEVRAFSFFASAQAVIVVNQSDAPSARVFSLFHEMCHLLLAEPGICLPEESSFTVDRRIETYCNRFAAALLVPAPDLSKQLSGKGVHLESVGTLAARYRVSPQVVLGRLRVLHAITDQEYQQAARRLTPKSARPKRPRKGGPTVPTRVLSERGRPFASLVMNAMRQDLITINDAASYLGIKLKYMQEVAARIDQREADRRL